MGYVPTLELDNGERITEGPVIVQYLADQKPGSGLAPAKVERAIKLSKEKYCSASIMLAATAEMTHSWRVLPPEGQADAAQ